MQKKAKADAPAPPAAVLDANAMEQMFGSAGNAAAWGFNVPALAAAAAAPAPAPAGINPDRYPIVKVTKNQTIDELASEKGLSIGRGDAYYLLESKAENVKSVPATLSVL